MPLGRSLQAGRQRRDRAHLVRDLAVVGRHLYPPMAAFAKSWRSGRLQAARGAGAELGSLVFRHVETEMKIRRKSLIVKRSIRTAGLRTGVSVEDAFWNGLKEIAADSNMTLSDLVNTINSKRKHNNLSSAIRLFVLDFYRRQVAAAAEFRLYVEQRKRLVQKERD